jgi:hypothetical protein
MLYECDCCRGMRETDCFSRDANRFPVICLRCEQEFLEERTALRGDETYALAYHRSVAAAAATAVMSGVIGNC